MAEPTPNAAQQALIDGTEGVYLVDAGAGTGKTFALTHRYANIVDAEGVDPDDVLLVTFTRSAATEMKDRIVDHCDYAMRQLADAPIQTFHSYCHDLLQEHGFAAPTHLGLDERITGSTEIVEDSLRERTLFAEFFGEFRDGHPEHAEFYRVLGDPDELRTLIAELAAKGVFPTTDGWYRNGEASLDGDFDAFRENFDAVNQPRNDGRAQSPLRKQLNRYDGDAKTYLPDAPPKAELRGPRGTKALDPSVAEQVFHADRTALKDFVHDVYVEYLRFALRRNYLTFGFLQLFAFVLLTADDRLREHAGFEYVMVDEFQDSSEIQFKLALLLCAGENLCVVGDWKQSIYSFQYADVRNILAFEERLEAYSRELTDDEDTERVRLGTDGLTRIELTENYRSTQTLLDFSEHALVTPATGKDEVDDGILADVVPLSTNAPFDNTMIEGYHHAEEPEALLSLIQDIEDNEAFAVSDEEGELRPPEFGDIAVFTRTRDFGRELLALADEYGFPMAYDGGVEIFRTDQAKLVLAWLRILEADDDRGWALVLEEAGHTLDEIARLLDTGAYPEEMLAFRETLRGMESMGARVRRVFDRYGFAGETADVLLHTIQQLYVATTVTPGDLIRYIEAGIEHGTTKDVNAGAGTNSVTVQTIHTAKGLEYPIVILANMNANAFPPSGGGSPIIQYDDPVGLRQRKLYAEVHEHPHVYDNWRTDVLRYCYPRDYDEERRLLYVAITRAEQHVLFVGGEEPNTFLEELPVDLAEHEPEIGPVSRDAGVQAELPFSVRMPAGPIGLSAHALMDDSVFEAAGARMERDDDDVEVRGTDRGARVHDFAEAYSLGADVRPENEDERRVKALLDGLSGEVCVEERITLPLEADGERVTVSGLVDLVHETPDAVEIIDYKTDRSRRAHDEYVKQLSVYYHVVSAHFAGKPVSASLFYTNDDELREIEPLSLRELEEIVRAETDVLA